MDTPNRILLSHGCTVTASFGDVYAAVPMHHVPGLGHVEHLKLHFFGGLSLELTRAAAVELARRLPEAIAALPVEPDLSGARAHIGDEERYA